MRVLTNFMFHWQVALNFRIYKYLKQQFTPRCFGMPKTNESCISTNKVSNLSVLLSLLLPRLQFGLIGFLLIFKVFPLKWWITGTGTNACSQAVLRGMHWTTWAGGPRAGLGTRGFLEVPSNPGRVTHSVTHPTIKWYLPKNSLLGKGTDCFFQNHFMSRRWWWFSNPNQLAHSIVSHNHTKKKKNNNKCKYQQNYGFFD